MKTKWLIGLLLISSFQTLKADSCFTSKHLRRIELGTTVLTHLALAKLWYADYPQSKFHWFNDNKEWQQIDKLGHAYSAYNLGVLSMEMAKKAGVQKNKIWQWGLFGSLFQNPIEIWDGFSAGWGASWGDLLANSFGTALCIGQEQLWHEQRIQFKFMYQATNYAAIRPNVLGSTIPERLLKDYNGQSYWLSFSPIKKHPVWAISFGYGAKGMLGAFENKWQNAQQQSFDYSNIQRYKTYYLSLDIHWSAIKTKRKGLKTVFKILDGIKIPMPGIGFCQQKWALKGFNY
jgi:uncharacterized protein YfiM (DUF2279 family)